MKCVSCGMEMTTLGCPICDNRYSPKWCAEECDAASAEIARLRSALARAEEERDEARKETDKVKRLYCRQIAKHGERIYGAGDRCAWNTPRKVCAQEWPDDADRLFPRGG